MSDEAQTPKAAAKKKGGAGPIIIGLVLALVLGGATAYAVMSGLAPIPGAEHADADGGHGKKDARADEHVEEGPPPKFVMFDPLTVTFIQDGAARQLRIALSVETTEPYLHKVEEEKPRILDAINTLLRALDERDLSEPSALDRLRAQMLRRVRISTDPTAIQDLLITEYVIL